MNMTFSKRNRTPSEVSSVAIEIDVTPVMNMFVILIPFLVSMAVFTQLSIIEFSLPPNIGTQLDTSKGKPKLKLTVVVAKDYCAITQGENMLDSIGAIGDDYNFPILSEKLKMRRRESKITDEMIIAVRDEIKFKSVVKIMDLCREVGFDGIGLSSAFVPVDSL